jgi:hypothetical protein
MTAIGRFIPVHVITSTAAIPLTLPRSHGLVITCTIQATQLASEHNNATFSGWAGTVPTYRIEEDASVPTTSSYGRDQTT